MDHTESRVLLGTVRRKDMEEAGMQGVWEKPFRYAGSWVIEGRLLQLRNRTSDSDSVFTSL